MDTGLRRRTSTLTKYGTRVAPPVDDAVTYPHDDNYSFLAKGRDYESAYTNHKFTRQEREVLASFESLNYLPSHSSAYRHWLKRQPRRLDWDRWIMMGFIGLAVGIIGFFLHQVIEVISELKWKTTMSLISDGRLLLGFLCFLGFGLALVLISSLTVVFLRPSAGGSGIPELIGFLNGTVIRHIFNIKTMSIKFISCACAVAAGLPVGPEGPMIHLGSLVGAGLSQFKSDTMKFSLPFFERFRNSEDRRNFISAGAAAGIASAFGAPVGGLLFSMEEVSSFWNMKLSWQIFFCSMVSTFTTDLLNSAFQGFRYSGDFGAFKVEKYIIFQVTRGLSVNLLVFLPTVLIGFVGGLLGALFTFLNLRITRTRKKLLAKISRQWTRNFVRIFEPCLIMTIVVALSTFLPLLWPCRSVECRVVPKANSLSLEAERTINESTSKYCQLRNINDGQIELSLNHYKCSEPQHINSSVYVNETFNELASLLLINGEEAIHHLFSRRTHYQFGFGTLLTALPIYFLLSCWSAGTSISSGLVVPFLFIGALYGRAIGLAIVTLFKVPADPASYWAWIDPGAFALIGSAAFFGGVSRLTMSLTVIMIEITNDVKFLLPIMVAIMVAKLIGDYFTHPLYHALLELKCIPFLDSEPIVCNENHEVVNLELYEAKCVMSSPVVTLHSISSVQAIAHCLLDSTHGGFPVLSDGDINSADDNIFVGLVTRLELAVILKNESLFCTFDEARNEDSKDVTIVEYQMLTLDKLHDPDAVHAMLQRYCDEESYSNRYINLMPFIDRSCPTIHQHFSLHRTYIIFRTLGMRHLVVTDNHNKVVGIITRKDILGFQLEERLAPLINVPMTTELLTANCTEVNPNSNNSSVAI